MALYEAIGGMRACRRLAEAFYARVELDPVLRPIYPRSFHCAVPALGFFLAQHFGGPCEYAGQRWSLSLYEAHLRFKINRAASEAWLTNMIAAMEDVRIPDAERAEMTKFFAEASAHLVNQPSSGPPTDALPFDLAVEAVRRADVARVAELSHHEEFRRDRSAWLGLLAVMAATSDPQILTYALGRLDADPQLAHERFTYDRTLLHAAAAEGCLPMVELLLRLGADPNAQDRFGHSALYHVGNECSRETGPAVVRTLAAGGADVNLQDRVKRCTALHMAARRGNLQVAQALLDCGADTEIPDRNGVTALGRAVNCAKPEVADLLRAHSRY